MGSRASFRWVKMTRNAAQHAARSELARSELARASRTHSTRELGMLSALAMPTLEASPVTVKANSWRRPGRETRRGWCRRHSHPEEVSP